MIKGFTAGASAQSCTHWFLIALCLLAFGADPAQANPPNLQDLNQCNDPNMTDRERSRCRRNTTVHNANAHKSQGQDDPGSYGTQYSDLLVEERDGVNQLDQQKDGESNKNAGAGAANNLGMMLTGIGTGMIATGVALNASSHCGCAGMPLIASGVFFLAGAAGSFGAGGAMSADAATNFDYGKHLDDLSNFDGSLGNPTNPGFNVDDGGNSGGVPNFNGNPSSPGNSATPTASTSTGFRVDESSLSNGRLGQSLDELEALGLSDREAFVNAIANGEDLGGLLQQNGLIKDKGAFDEMLKAQKVDQAALIADFKSGKYDEFGNLIEGADEKASGADYAGGGKGLEQGEGEASQEGEVKPGEGPVTFDDIVAQMMKKGGKGPQSLKDILGITGKGSKKKGLAKDGGPEGLDGLRGLASDTEAKYAFVDHTDLDSEYEEKTLFKRVHLIYRVRTGDMLPTEWYIRNRIQE